MSFNKSENKKAREILENKGYEKKSDGRYINSSGTVAAFSETGGSVKVGGHTYNSTSDLKNRKG